MKKVQSERNELLRYVLQHPPANVVILLPDGATSLEKIDLTLCPLPLGVYAEAEKAAARVKSGPPPTFSFDMQQCITFMGGSSGEVQRLGASARPSKSPRDGHTGSEAKTDAISGHHRHSPRQGGSSTPHHAPDSATTASSPAAGGEGASSTSAAAADRHGKPEAPPSQRIVATEQSAPRPASAHGSATASANTSTTAPPAAEPFKGFFGHIANAFRGLGAGGDGANNASGSAESRSTGAHTPQRGGSRAEAVGKPRQRRPTNAGTTGLFASLWNPLASVQGTLKSDASMSASGAVKEEQEAADMTHQLEQAQIPLCGSTPGTMSANILTQFGPVFNAVEEKRKTSGATGAAARDFPRPPNIQLCEVLNSAPLTPFLDILPIFAYDNLLLATSVLLTRKHDLYARELRNVYRSVFNITEEQHQRAIANLAPPALQRPIDESDEVAMAERRRMISDLRADAPTLRLLCEHSDDDEFVSRTEQLLCVIEHFPDSPGDTQVPFAIRAMVFATCLLPLYQLDLSTLNPLYTEADVENCLSLLRGRLGISQQTERYCHLHAQLLANDQCGSIEAQAVFLKDVARAVSSLGTHDILQSPLTPPVKYAYYVLQETFCLAAVPMPWLDSTFSYDMQRSVSAVFIETCLALPPCMLSAMLLVEDMPLLPPSANVEAFLLTFMETFVNSGVFRNYAELSNTTTELDKGSAVALFQRLNTGLDAQQRSYCKMLTRSFPLATLLIVPGRLRIGAYVLLVRHWNNEYPGDSHELPKDYHIAMDAFLYYLLEGSGGEKRTCQSEGLCALMRRSTHSYLTPFTDLAKYEEASFVQFATQQLDGLHLQWSNKLEQAGDPLSDVQVFARTVFDAPRPPALSGDPVAQEQARLAGWVNIVSALLARCMEGFPPLSSPGCNAKVPAIAVEYERLRSAEAELKYFAALLPGGVHRLHTLVRVKEAIGECLARSHRQYELVRRVTGAAAASQDEVHDTVSRSIFSAVLQLCDSISIEILATDAVKSLLAKFVRFDAKQYQTLKRSHAKNEDFPMPREFPNVTMRRILDEVQRAFERVSAFLNYEPAVRQVHYRIGHNLTAYLFAVYVDGPGVFLSTADAPLILADLDLVRSFFFEVKADLSPNFVAADSINGGGGGGCQSAAQILRTSGAELLEKLYRIVQYVMSKPSSELESGGVGVPPLHTLPESSDDSPWCQYVVRRVLEHRKDFRRSTWLSYQPRQRTK